MPSRKRARVSSNSPLDKIFTPPETTETGRSKKAKTGDAPHRASPRQSSVQLYEDQLDWLDHLRIEARKDDGRRLRKTELIRALVDLAMRYEVDMRGVQSEAEIIERFERAIRGG